MVYEIKDRNEYIGSSDAKTIIGDDWQDLWERKTGRKDPDDLSEVFRVQLGVFTEEFHLDWTFRKFQNEQADPDNWEMSKLNKSQKQHEYVRSTGQNTPLRSHPDALLSYFGKAVSVENIDIPVEVKHSGAFLNSNAACDYYMPQLQHHMFCWGQRHCLFSVILGNNEPDRIWVERNDEYVGHYLAKADEFWNYVKADIKPNYRTGSVMHTSVTDSIRKNGMVRRNISEDNHMTSLVQDLYETAYAAKQHSDTKTIIKKEMKEDEAELYSERVSIKKNKRGAVTIKLMGA